jgi:hypothetical protein
MKIDDEIERLVNRYSIAEILSSIIRVCEKADKNYPDWGWESDKDLISEILPRIKN